MKIKKYGNCLLFASIVVVLASVAVIGVVTSDNDMSMNTSDETTAPSVFGAPVYYDYNHTITASAGFGGSISPSSATVYSGGSQTFTITASAGYTISDVKVDGVSVGVVSTYTFTNVTSNHTISATFSGGQFTITASAGYGGWISPSSATVSQGGSKTFNITTFSGYTISNVIVDGASVGSVSTYTFTNVTRDHTISVEFLTQHYTITVNAYYGGSISPGISMSVYSGAYTTFKITAWDGYEIDNVIVDGVSMGGISTYTFNNVTSNHTISATFYETAEDNAINFGLLFAAILAFLVLLFMIIMYMMSMNTKK
ncbi:MAG: hypothetical protein KRP56_02855 [Candidatus Methanogranum gryphiswaldense]|nr:MAG: hypothetical protein KRP56_02855 [Candidatus Methanogranum sp. U3.2.1]